MGVFRQFPYSNFHEMNMDEIIKIVKNMLEEWAQYYDTWDDWKNQVTQEWSEMQSFINNYFDNLNVQTEINNKITAMVNSGEFSQIVDPYVPPAVADWLAEHITTPETVVIDDSLTIEGAAADAKATGDAIDDLQTSLYRNVNNADFITNAYQGAILYASPPQEFINMELTESNTRIRTINDKSSVMNGIIIPANVEIKISADDGYKFAYQVYSTTTGQALDTYAFKTGSYTIEKTEKVSMVLVLAKTNDSSITPSEISHVIVEANNDLKTEIKNLQNAIQQNITPPFTLDGINASIYKNVAGRYLVNVTPPKIRKNNGVIIYVSPNGSDTNNGLTVNTPVKTLTKALNTSNIETIILLSGTYVAGVNYNIGANIDTSINLIGLDNVIIDNVQYSNNNPLTFTEPCYIENIHFKHGNNTAKAILNAGDVITFKNCKFSNSDTALWSNGLSILGGSACIINCQAYNNAYDGFNYHANDSVINYAIEIDCEAYNNGLTALSSPDGQSSNGSTTHDGSYIIRVNCNYYACHGGIIADLNSSSANYGCRAGISSVTNSTDFPDRMSNYWSSNSVMYLYDCESYGSKYDTAIVNSGSIISNITYDYNYPE